MEMSCSFIFWLFVFVCHEDKNSAKYYFPTPEEKRKARIDVILMQIEQSHSWDFMSRSLEDAQWIFISQLHRHRMNTCFVTSQCIGCSLHCLRRLQRFPKPSTFQCQIPDWQESCILRSTNWLELALSPLIPRWLSQHREAEFTSQFQRFCLPCLVAFGCRWFKMIWYDSMIPR